MNAGGTRVVPVREFLAARERGDQAIERAFFAGLLLRNGVYKTTEERRMDSLFPLLARHARALAARPLRVLDIACSSGVTTVELDRALAGAGFEVETTGTDLTLAADYVVRDDGAALFFDTRGAVLQVELGDWASPWRFRPRDLMWHTSRVARARALIAREAEAFRAARRGAPGFSATRVALLAGATHASPAVRFIEEDILEPQAEGPFDLVRVANLLKRGNFDADTLRRMVTVVGGRVAPDGLLLILRSHGSPPVHHGTLFRRCGTRFEEADRIGAGSEVAALVLAAHIPYNGAGHASLSS
jgi:hypothetical protein